jgi:hypothetical protein
MALLAGLFPWEWLHPGGSGYWFYSGVFDVGILLGILSSVGVYWRSHNCHVTGCWRLDWHPHPEHQHPVCRAHHPHGGAGFLHARHHRVKVSTFGSPAAGFSAHAETPEPTVQQPQRDGTRSNGSVVAAPGSTWDEGLR